MIAKVRVTASTLRTLRMVAAGRTGDDEAVRLHAAGLLKALRDGEQIPRALRMADVRVRAKKARVKGER